MLSLVNNFIDNAVKASADNSRLILEATAEKLMVRDFGKGIPAEDLDKVTEAFYMVDKSRSRANGSVGLGLALCKKIADIHGFQMKIESEIGKVQGLQLEYFEIVDGNTLQSIANWDDTTYAVGCITVFCGEVRLIDNIKYKE